MPEMLFYVRGGGGGGGCISSVFIKSPIGIKSITLQHDRADEIVFSMYTKVNLITRNIVWKTCECEWNVYSLAVTCLAPLNSA